MKTRLLCSLTLLIVAYYLLSMTGFAGQEKADPQEGAAIQKLAEAFLEAFHKGDARAVAACWSSDGEYVTQGGEKLKGREAIEKAFAGFFARHKGSKLRILSESLRFVKPDVALEEGVTEVYPPDEGLPSRARYRNVLVKQEGQWLLSSVKDSAYIPPSSFDHLRVLDWAVGEWASDGPRGPVEHLTLDWTETRNFLVGSFSTTVKNVSVGSAKHWIAWDPEARRIRSWIFDDSGAFGEGAWTQDGDKWIVKTSMVLADAKKASATYVLRHVDHDALGLEVRGRTENGKALPDIKEVQLKRVK